MPPAGQEFVLSCLFGKALDTQVGETLEQLNCNSRNSTLLSSNKPDVVLQTTGQSNRKRQRGDQPRHKGRSENWCCLSKLRRAMIYIATL